MVTLPLAWGCRAGGLGSHILQNQTISKITNGIIESVLIENKEKVCLHNLAPKQFAPPLKQQPIKAFYFLTTCHIDAHRSIQSVPNAKIKVES